MILVILAVVAVIILIAMCCAVLWAAWVEWRPLSWYRSYLRRTWGGQDDGNE